MRNIIFGASNRNRIKGVCFGLAVSILASPAYGGYTLYDDFAEWQATVGSYQVEDFESYSVMEFPQEGGQIPLNHFTLEADSNGSDEWGPGGIVPYNYPGFEGFYTGPALGLGFLTTLEDCGGLCGPTYARALFHEPIIGLFLDVPWTEDGYLDLNAGADRISLNFDCVGDFPCNLGGSYGVVFDQPLTTIGFDAEHSWAFIDTMYSAPVSVPEPGSLSLLAAGLVGLGFMRRKQAA